MDSYTEETQRWLDARYRKATDDGIYFAHQNIYGFRARLLVTSVDGKRSGYSEDGSVLRYIIFWNIIKALKKLQFESLLDVGGSEGYMAGAIRDLFHVRTRACDLSAEACKRAKEIFNVDADTVDGVSLPYADGSFDVVVCSESMEHIPQYELVLQELLRVARKAVIVTVPHDGPEEVARVIREKVPHGHIHDFTLDTLTSLVPASCQVYAAGHRSYLLRLGYAMVEGKPIMLKSRNPLLVKIADSIVTLSRPFMNETALKLLFAVDPFFSTILNTYRGVSYLIVKDPSALAAPPRPQVTLEAILNYKVPLHVMQKN